MQVLVMSIHVYACETWTLTAELEMKIQVTEMNFFPEKCWTSTSVTISPKKLSKNLLRLRLNHMKKCWPHEEKETSVVWPCNTI